MSKNSTRIYLVTELAPVADRAHTLVRASNVAQALRVVASTRYTVGVASAEDVYCCARSGIDIIDAAEPTPGATDEQ